MNRAPTAIQHIIGTPIFQPRPQSNFKRIALAPRDFAGNLYLI